MHRNFFIAVSLALALASSSAVAETAQSHASAARKAERRGDWQKALEEWKAAYGLEINADYLIGIGDAYAKLGNKEEARKQYDAYVSDPLASPKTVEKVKVKMAALDAPSMPGLDLPSMPAADASAPVALPGLSDLPPPPEAGGRKRKGKKDRELAAAMPGLDLPLPGAPAAQPATAGGLALPDVPPPAVADNGKGKKGKKDLATPLPMPGLDLPMLPPSTTAAAAPAQAPATLPAPKSPAQIAATPAQPPKAPAANTPAPRTVASSSSTGVRPASTSTATVPERKAVPDSVIAETPSRPVPQSGSSSGKVVAWVAAGVAVAALGGGFLAYSAASSADKDLTGSVHERAVATQLLESEKRNKSLALVGLSAGLLSAGIATALFTF